MIAYNYSVVVGMYIVTFLSARNVDNFKWNTVINLVVPMGNMLVSGQEKG